MASLGLPGLAGFWGEFPAILAAYNPGGDLNIYVFRTYMVVAAIGTVLAAAYLLWLLQRTAFGTPSEEFEDDPDVKDIVPTEYIAWFPFVLLIVILGFVPGIIFDVTDDAVSSLAEVWPRAR